MFFLEFLTLILIKNFTLHLKNLGKSFFIIYG